jgi:hypothetical protein
MIRDHSRLSLPRKNVLSRSERRQSRDCGQIFFAAMLTLCYIFLQEKNDTDREVIVSIPSKIGVCFMRGLVLFAVGFLGLILLVGNSEGQGEPKKGKDGKVTGQLPQNWKELNLTAAQKEKVYEVNAKFKARLDALAEQEKAIKAEQKAEQYKILTADQKEMLQKIITGEAPRKTIEPPKKTVDKK